MIYYFLIILLIIIFFKCFKRKTSLFLSFSLLALFAGLRKYTVGVDTLQFYEAFTNIGQTDDWTFSEFRYEYGFSLLCKILYLIFKEPQSLIFVTSIFINFSVYTFIKNNSKDYFLSTLLYIFLNYYFNYMNIMRQAIAIAILLLFYKFLKNKQYLFYLFGVIIAFFFHKTAIMGLVLILVIMISKFKYLNFTIATCGIIAFTFYKEIFMFGASFLGDYYLAYLDTEFAVSNYFGSLLMVLQSFGISISCGYLYYKTRKKDRLEDSSFLMAISIVTLCCLALVMRMNIFNRISAIFEIYLIIFVPNILDNYKRPSGYILKNRLILTSSIKYFCLFLTLLFFLGINFLRPEWYGVVPYEFFFI